MKDCYKYENQSKFFWFDSNESPTSEWITNAYTSFQVEVFKNPTFTAEVKLSSPEVTNGIINNIREVANNDPNTQWYEKAYKSNFSIE